MLCFVLRIESLRKNIDALRRLPALLDAIDAIAAPGTDVVEEDPSVDPPSLLARNRRSYR